MGSPKKAGAAAAGKSVIVIAGEGQNDRDVLRHLVPALGPWPATRRPKLVEIKKKMALSKAQDQLVPRLNELRLLAQGAARLANARLAGIAVHVDFDAVIDERYESRRKQLSTDLRRTFDCDTALALAADEMEAWLMLFPDAFPKVKPGWRLTDQDRRRNLGLIAGGSKELLKARLTQPPYRETDAPAVMKAAVDHNLVTTCEQHRNRSYADFAAEVHEWR
jgi:hypothetical protein